MRPRSARRVSLLALTCTAAAGLAWTAHQPEPPADTQPEKTPENDSTLTLGQQLIKRLLDSYTTGMPRWKASMTPELAHEFLAAHLVGEWETTVEFLDQSGTVNATSAWETSGEKVLGGRFIKWTAKGDLMGLPYENTSMFGYDNDRKLFHLTTFDTISTSVSTLWGSIDEDGKTVTLIGPMNEPMTGEVGKPFGILWTFNDDGTNVYEVREIEHGEPFAVLRVTSKPKG